MSQNILVVAAHPDDEVLGCGGTIARHADRGDKVTILLASEGATSRGSKRDQHKYKHELDCLAGSAKLSSDILGASELIHLGLPDNRLDSLDLLDVVKHIEDVSSTVQPDLVYVHHSGDLNIDHRILNQAVLTAFRPLPSSKNITLLAYEVSSSTEWQPPSSSFSSFWPNWYVDITDQWERKLKALNVYQQEMRPWPHSRSCEAVEHLARLRGSQIGRHYAEAFTLLRNVT